MGMRKAIVSLIALCGVMVVTLAPAMSSGQSAAGLPGTKAAALERLTELKFPRAPVRPKGMPDEDIAPVKNLIDRAKRRQLQSIRDRAEIVSHSIDFVEMSSHGKDQP